MTVQRVFDADARVHAIGFWSIRVSIIIGVATLLLYALAVIPGVPYHIRELFGPNPTLPQALMFAMVVLLGLGPPAMLGLQLIRLPVARAWLFPLGVLAHGVIVFFAFRYATPIASVHDLLGEPVWALGGEWERMVRFVAAFLNVSLPIAGATALVYALTRSFAPRRFFLFVLFAGILTLGGYLVVVVNAATTNVTELLRGDDDLISWLGFGLWLGLIAFAASLVAERLSGVLGDSLAAGFAVLLFLPLSYGVLFLTLEPQVGGPFSELSALEFLLSATRERYFFLPVEIFGRYSVGYLIAVLLLVFAQYPVWLAYSTRRFGNAAVRMASEVGENGPGMAKKGDGSVSRNDGSKG